MMHITVILSAAKDLGVSHALRFLAALGMTLSTQPAPLAAQDDPTDWLRVLQPRVCVPTDACPPRRGMIWDSTNVAPRYPEVLRVIGIGGDVEVSLRVRGDGTVLPGSVRVERASQGVLGVSVAEAAPQWRFTTAAEERPSEAVRVRMQVVYAYEGPCRDGTPSPQRVGWARDDQLMISTCSVGSPTMVLDSVALRAGRVARPVTISDSLAVSRALRQVIEARRSPGSRPRGS